VKQWLQFVVSSALILISIPTLGQTSPSTEKPDELDAFVREYGKSSARAKKTSPATTAKPGTSNACKKVGTLAALIDGAFDGQKMRGGWSAPF
jgi:hypothetical protein